MNCQSDNQKCISCHFEFDYVEIWQSQNFTPMSAVIFFCKSYFKIDACLKFISCITDFNNRDLS